MILKIILTVFVLMADLAIVIYGLYTIFFSLVDKEESRIIKIKNAVIITFTLILPAFYFWGRFLIHILDLLK